MSASKIILDKYNRVLGVKQRAPRNRWRGHKDSTIIANFLAIAVNEQDKWFPFAACAVNFNTLIHRYSSCVCTAAAPLFAKQGDSVTLCQNSGIV
jgi:hypothetical protein